MCGSHLLAGGWLLLGTTLSGQSLSQRPATTATAPSVQEQQQDRAAFLPAGTSMQVEVLRNYPMKAGEALDGELVYPIYADGRLVASAHTHVRGNVTSLEPDQRTRWHGRLRGDFTPFHIASVQFNEIDLPGDLQPIKALPVSDGAPVLHLTTPGVAPKRSFFIRQMATLKDQLHNQAALITAPGLKDRALQMLYHQLPYHPERIRAKTAWTFELAEPVTLTAVPPVQTDTEARAQGKPETWHVNATLDQGISSATAKTGDAVTALVVEPVVDKDRQLVIPQGSKLLGHVTYAKPARSLGRNGKLRFTFQSIQFPTGMGTQIEGALAGASTEKTQDLKLDAEGTVSPRNQSSAVAPLLLTLLAGRALDDDGNLTAQTGVASNGFGLVGRVAGIAARDRNVAASIGFYAAGLSFYENFLRPGHDVVFRKDTRIEIQTTPLRAPVLTPKN
ncbi:TrbI/VirB10 family protein [Acidicapsa dinghuensis]|uniref:TrbI/VirB10 family protein n=1 Tax=Acidicapsa dinghuensis TaxID=2218256 RepID=A0ABW1EC57_9BACT|nr:TrbI/VirB10 family protein [Acidicapsa dinghuensis]